MTSTAAFDIVPYWDGTTATLDAYEARVKLYVMSTKKDEKCLCGPRLLARFAPESDSFRIVREALTDEQLTKEDGSGGRAIVQALRVQLGPKSMQQAVSGESMKKWTTRFALSLKKVGAALHAACSEIPATGFLHPMIQGILLAETSGLTPSEFASVLGTSGKTGAEGEKIGNSWLVTDLITAFCDQWSDDAIALRDSRSRRTESVNAAVESYSFGQHGPIDEYEEYYEEEEGVYGAEEEYYEEDAAVGSGGKTLHAEESAAQAEAYLVEQFLSLIHI